MLINDGPLVTTYKIVQSKLNPQDKYKVRVVPLQHYGSTQILNSSVPAYVSRNREYLSEQSVLHLLMS